MANKVAAMLVMCLVLVAAVHQLPTVAAKTDNYGRCFNGCEKKCIDKGNGYTICEMQCDTDCYNKDVAEKLHIKFN